MESQEFEELVIQGAILVGRNALHHREGWVPSPGPPVNETVVGYLVWPVRVMVGTLLFPLILLPAGLIIGPHRTMRWTRIALYRILGKPVPFTEPVVSPSPPIPTEAEEEIVEVGDWWNEAE